MERSTAWYRVLGLTLLLFCLCVAYCILRNLKDAVTLSTHSSGAEVIPYLKVWGILPGAFLFTALTSFLVERLGRCQAFFGLISVFLAYYWWFALIYTQDPQAYVLEGLESHLAASLPTGARGWVSMFSHWPASLFYVFSELWATIIVAVLFWGSANLLMQRGEAERYFGIVKIGGTASAFVAGQLANWASFEEFSLTFPWGRTAWEQTLLMELGCVTFLTGISLILFLCLFSGKTGGHRPRRVRMGFGESLAMVRRSPYLTSLACVVVGYTLVFNLADVVWKQMVKDHYQDAGAILRFMNQVMTWIGLVSLLATLGSGWIVRRWGWGCLAVATPILVLLCSASFFSCWLFGAAWGIQVTSACLIIGAVQNAVSKAAKYSVFDVSKEMAYMVLDEDERWYGKAAIDGVGNDLGKTGSSLVHQSTLLVMGSMATAVPLIAGIIFTSLFLWLQAVWRMNDKYEKATQREFLPSSPSGPDCCPNPGSVSEILV